MPYKEREIEKMYYTIGEVAKMFHVNTSHIRFWSKQFDIIKPATNKKGNRLFTMSDIENFKVIYHLVKEKGFTLKGARIEMQAMKKKMKLESKPEVTFSDAQSKLPFDTEALNGEPVSSGNIVDKIALKNSLLKMRGSLVEIQEQLERLEA